MRGRCGGRRLRAGPNARLLLRENRQPIKAWMLGRLSSTYRVLVTVVEEIIPCTGLLTPADLQRARTAW